MNTSPVKSAWACGRNVICLSSFFVYLFVARNVYDNYYRRHEPVVRWLCSTMLLNWPDYRGAMCVFHSLAPERIHLECLYNGPTKIAPRMHHHWHSLAAISSHAMNENKKRVTEREWKWLLDEIQTKENIWNFCLFRRWSRITELRHLEYHITLNSHTYASQHQPIQLATHSSLLVIIMNEIGATIQTHTHTWYSTCTRRFIPHTQKSINKKKKTHERTEMHTLCVSVVSVAMMIWWWRCWSL